MKKMNMLYRDPKEGQSDEPTVPAETPSVPEETTETAEGAPEEAAGDAE